MLNNFKKNILIEKSLNKLIYNKIICNILFIINFNKQDTNFAKERKRN